MQGWCWCAVLVGQSSSQSLSVYRASDGETIRTVTVQEHVMQHVMAQPYINMDTLVFTHTQVPVHTVPLITHV